MSSKTTVLFAKIFYRHVNLHVALLNCLGALGQAGSVAAQELPVSLLY